MILCDEYGLSASHTDRCDPKVCVWSRTCTKSKSMLPDVFMRFGFVRWSMLQTFSKTKKPSDETNTYMLSWLAQVLLCGSTLSEREKACCHLCSSRHNSIVWQVASLRGLTRSHLLLPLRLGLHTYSGCKSYLAELPHCDVLPPAVTALRDRGTVRLQVRGHSVAFQ